MVTNRITRVLRLAVLAALALSVTSCADLFRNDDEESYRFTSKLSHLSLSTRNVFCNEKFNISFDYEDKQNDIVRIVVLFLGKDKGGTVREDFGWTVSEDVVHPAEGVGTCMVTYSFPCDAGWAPEDEYTVKVNVVDDNDHESNILVGTINLQ